MHAPSRSILVALTALLLGFSSASAQQQVTGTVRDATTLEALPGASVVLQGTTRGTSTGIDGEFSLEVPSLRDTLVVSFVGYDSQTVPLAGRSEVVVSLLSSVAEGEEVVVVGYTTERERNITGAVTQISAEEISDRQLGTLEQALQGRDHIVQRLEGKKGLPARPECLGEGILGEGVVGR